MEELRNHGKTHPVQWRFEDSWALHQSVGGDRNGNRGRPAPDSGDPVSYTHLDVYKRQDEASAEPED